MAGLTPEIAEAIVARGREQLADVAESLGRALDGPVEVNVGDAEPAALGALPAELSGPGLAVAMIVGNSAAVLLLPAASGLLPKWSQRPDATGTSKLDTLGWELGVALLPEDLATDDCKSGWLANLADGCVRAGLAEAAVRVPLQLACGGTKAVASLLLPFEKVGKLFVAPVAKADAAAKQATPTPVMAKPAPALAAPATIKPPPAKRSLPLYAKSLLRIRVPVIVTLAAQRQPLRRIVELGPGTIIQFDKSCEEMLELEVGNRPIAQGEAVKVGDKFGLRITSMIRGEERFVPVTSKKH